MTLDPSRKSFKKPNCPVGVDLFHADERTYGRTDGRTRRTNSRFSQFCECAQQFQHNVNLKLSQTTTLYWNNEQNKLHRIKNLLPCTWFSNHLVRLYCCIPRYKSLTAKFMQLVTLDLPKIWYEQSLCKFHGLLWKLISLRCLIFKCIRRIVKSDY